MNRMYLIIPPTALLPIMPSESQETLIAGTVVIAIYVIAVAALTFLPFKTTKVETVATRK